mgnify:CR=1 FL=1
MKESFEDNIGLLIHDVARLLRVLYDRQMASIGLTRSQWWLLTYLYFKDGINQSELATLMDIEKAPGADASPSPILSLNLNTPMPGA